MAVPIPPVPPVTNAIRDCMIHPPLRRHGAAGPHCTHSTMGV